MAKLLKLRRGTTTQHGSFTGAEGEVTVDTTKDTLVVHDGSTQSGHTLLREDMSNLPAGTIDNADVNSSAAIAGTKISPDFGSQNTTTTGIAAVGELQVTSTAPKILLTDSDSNPDFEIRNLNGSLNFKDTTNDSTKLSLQQSQVTITDNLDCGSGVDVTGNITVTGTVDGVDVAALNTTVGNLGISGGAIASSTTATTQSASDNSTKVATTAYTDTAISNLVDSSPAALNTLNELAAAINDDASFSTTITNSIATKMPLSGGTFTGSVIVGNGGTSVSDAGLVVSADDSGAALFLQRSGTGRFDCSVANESGSLVFRGGSDSSTVAGLTNRMSIHGSTGNVTVAQNLDVGAGVDVTGNITVTGTVDGVDVATRDTLFGGLTSSSGVLTNGVTATTQSASDNTTKVATTAYVTTAIGNADAFPSGTVMLFAQSSAPTGWTKQTTHNNKALRVVSGSASSGGSNAFSNTFASRSLTANAGNTTAGGNVSVSIANANTSGNVNSHTLSINEIPSHSHGLGAASLGPPNGGSAARGASAANIGNMSTGNAGGGGGHSHGFSGGSHNHNANASFSGSAHNHNISVTNLDLEVQFVDVILAAKD